MPEEKLSKGAHVIRPDNIFMWSAVPQIKHNHGHGIFYSQMAGVRAWNIGSVFSIKLL